MPKAIPAEQVKRTFSTRVDGRYLVALEALVVAKTAAVQKHVLPSEVQREIVDRGVRALAAELGVSLAELGFEPEPKRMRVNGVNGKAARP